MTDTRYRSDEKVKILRIGDRYLWQCRRCGELSRNSLSGPVYAFNGGHAHWRRKHSRRSGKV